MSQLDTALTSIRAALAALPELTTIHTDPPDQITADTLPAVVVYPGPASWEFGSSYGGGGKPMYWAGFTVIVQLFLARPTLPVAIAKVRALQVLVPLALFAAYEQHRFDDSVVTLGTTSRASTTPPIRCTFGEEDWGSDMVRLPFEIDVLVEVEGT